MYYITKIGQDIDGEASGDNSGYSVSLSADGTIVAIGAVYNDGNGNDSGHVRIYKNQSGTWTQIGQDIDGEAANDYTGHWVSLSADGTILAIGATTNDGTNGVDSGHVRVFQYNGTNYWNQLGQDIDGEVSGDRSGWSVSLSNDGTRVAITSFYNDDSTENAGSVRIYQYSGNSWNQIGQDIDGVGHTDLTNSVSLSADGNIVAIGAYSHDGTSGNDSGHVRIFQYNGTNYWNQIGQDIDGEAAEDRSGYSISLSSDGTIVAIGAIYNDGNGNNSGHVRIYKNQSGTWTQIGQDIDGEASGDNSGWSVSLNSDGSVVAISAVYNGGNGVNSGHVRIYQNQSGIWTKIGDDIDGEAANEWSGYSVSLNADGTIVAIGAILNGDNGFYSGHVRVFNILRSPFTQIGDDIDGENSGDSSGWSVSSNADGSIVAIGAIYNDGNGQDSGHVRIYQNQSGTWTQIGQDLNGDDAFDYSGMVSLSADGSILAIGAYANHGFRGHVKIFQYNGNLWNQIGQDIDGEAVNDQSSFSVSLSDDGTIVAIGAIYNDGNGQDSGHVRIYQNQSGTWTQIGEDIDGEASGDRSGRSVSLSADGSIVAIGASFNKGVPSTTSGVNRGHVRIYQNQSGTWTQIGEDIDGESDNDYSGYSVSLSDDGTVVAIGAYNNYGENGQSSGHVRIYQNQSGTWTQIGHDIDGEASGDYSGISVSLSADGTVVVIGAYSNDGPNPPVFGNNGHVRVFNISLPLPPEPVIDSYTISSVSYETNTAIATNSPTVTNSADSFIITPALPSGLSFNTTTGEITGTPTAASVSTVYQITATNTGGNSQPFSLTIHVRSVLIGADIATEVSTYGFTNTTTATSKIASVTNKNEAIIKLPEALMAFKNMGDFNTFGTEFNRSSRKRKILQTSVREIFNSIDETENTIVVGHENISLIRDFTGTDTDRIDVVDLATGKTGLEFVKPNTDTYVDVDMENNLFYVPIGTGESAKIRDPLNNCKYLITKNNDLTYSIVKTDESTYTDETLDLGDNNVEGKTFVYESINNNNEVYRFICTWGSAEGGTASGGSPAAGAIGDPYLTTLSGITYKMDDFTGYVRLLQGEYDGKIFTINAENKLLTKLEIKELLEWRQTKMQGLNFSDNVRFGKFPAYFTKLFISHGDNYCIVDSNSLQVIESNYEPEISHSVEINKGYVWSNALKTTSCAKITVGELQVSMMSYEDKDIRNGFKLFNMDKLQNRSGALEHPIYVKDMKIRSIRSLVPIKQQSARKNKKVSKEEIIENGLKTQHTFKVF